MNKVSSLTNKSSSYEHGKMKNKNTINETGKDPEGIFSNMYLILGILIIAFCFIGYAMYHYLSTNTTLNIIANSSYYGNNMNTYEPLFKESANTIDDCINICSENLICDGITYNTDTQTCTGTKNGLIRNESPAFSAWIKPPGTKSAITSDFMKTILIGYTKNKKNIQGNTIQNPYKLGYFAYSLNITIYDFHAHYGSWRHIFHKGTPISDGTIVNYQSWESLVKDFPQQSIGVWLAPFTNNIRIAVTTTSLGNTNTGSYSQAFIQECDSITNDCYITDMPDGKWVDKKRMGDNSISNQTLNTFVEFFDYDLQNIPINTQLNIIINFLGNIAEVYFNGKIVKVVKLDGIPSINKSNLYVMNDITFGGEISNLLFYPDSLKLEDVNNIVALTPQK
jgi:hypothetical protein